MPLLSPEQVHELLEMAELHGGCRECGHRTAMEYCRSCDEFFWIHAAGCAMYEPKHHGHRLTLTPYVEDEGARPPADPRAVREGSQPMNRESHRRRHLLLHRALDELCADWALHNTLPGARAEDLKLFSNTTIAELMEWSHRQTQEPDELSEAHNVEDRGK
jgi:hypothetical protein